MPVPKMCDNYIESQQYYPADANRGGYRGASRGQNGRGGGPRGGRGYRGNKDKYQAGSNRENSGQYHQPIPIPRPPKPQELSGQVPPSSRLSTVSSTPRNDPLFMDSVMPVAGLGFTPVSGIPKVYTGFDGLPAISHETYRRMAAESNNFARKVAPSAFDYYAAILASARHIDAADKNGSEVSADEKNFAEKVEVMKFKPPKPIAKYLNGVGATSLPSGRKLRLARPSMVYQVADDVPGYFERVNQNTHYLYNSIPCTAVYFQRIREDILRTLDRNRPAVWNLPPGVRPADEAAAGAPTQNLLGWKPATRLKDDQFAFLTDCGFTEQGRIPFSVIGFPLAIDLMLSIQQEIDKLSFEQEEVSPELGGSQAQIVMVRPIGTQPTPHLTQEVVAYEPAKIASSLEICGGGLCYRVRKRVSRRGANPWAIYSFNNYGGVPPEWGVTANTFRLIEAPILQVEEFGSTSYLIEQYNDMLLEATMKKVKKTHVF